MNYDQAISAAIAGKKIRVPEWRGYWFVDPNIGVNGSLMAFTKTGDIVPAWEGDASLVQRTDWEEVDGLDFGWALTALKAGKAVCRSGWNGMFLFLAQVLNWGAQDHAFQKVSEKIDVGFPPSGRNIAVMADNKIVFGWAASHSDLIAEDWELAPEQST